jgi:hypothetical protein
LVITPNAERGGFMLLKNTAMVKPGTIGKPGLANRLPLSTSPKSELPVNDINRTDTVRKYTRQRTQEDAP